MLASGLGSYTASLATDLLDSAWSFGEYASTTGSGSTLSVYDQITGQNAGLFDAILSNQQSAPPPGMGLFFNKYA